MKAVIFDNKLSLVKNHSIPALKPGWALIRVQRAGICKTDLEIIKGYMGFKGVLGHEFLGVAESCDDISIAGKRVVGEINAACGNCDWCDRGLGRHCPQRTTLGIVNHDGCMAEYCTLPIENLHAVAPEISDNQAILTEPLAAACEILEQIKLYGNERIIVLGDGRLGILCAWALATIARDVTVMGHHPEKLDIARWRGIKTSLRGEGIAPGADIVVEATGSGNGIAQAMELCRPRGIIVLKSTVALQGEINLAPLVINELTVVGSRCGRFSDALAMMQSFPDMPLERLITQCYPLHQANEAFAVASQGQALKVVLEI
ncbi:MDR/zinc-dependent alcohol dehydrogenase-like family protein [Desulfonatronovibrio magnus]|uniref:MDR/zinc-dependent alcohol dehydrogenase-like family protein n=1 Tax=Desulfonatronovibrio magnus TaxID=698827 RepID=UPI0005EB408B|nr:alcohol dehydrogenase catalytic domain-containing protein [Desulfonatronovibrio magnus]